MKKSVAISAALMGIVLGAMGRLVGSAPASAEPNDEFVSCGPVLFGRPDPLPDPACAGSYAPFDALAIVLLIAAAIAFAVAVVAATRLWTTSRRQSSSTAATPDAQRQGLHPRLSTRSSSP